MCFPHRDVAVAPRPPTVALGYRRCFCYLYRCRCRCHRSCITFRSFFFCCLRRSCHCREDQFRLFVASFQAANETSRSSLTMRSHAGDCNGRGATPDSPISCADWPLDHELFLSCAKDTIRSNPAPSDRASCYASRPYRLVSSSRPLGLSVPTPPFRRARPFRF